MKPFSEYSLLIVDDEEDLREAISFDFRRKGFKVFTAASGNEGFEIVKNNKIDLVLSDVRMADGSGIDLLDRVKALDAVLPVVMLITGYSDMANEEAYDRGADAVFAKPFERKVIFDAVVRALKPAEERFSRDDLRLELELPVGIRCPFQNTSVRSRILNVGRGGMLVALENDIPINQEVIEFRMGLPQEPSVIVAGQGIVRWQRRESESGESPPGCGIEFSCFEPGSMKKLLELIQSLRTKPFIPRV